MRKSFITNIRQKIHLKIVQGVSLQLPLMMRDQLETNSPLRKPLQKHTRKVTIKNLNVLFLQQFFKKLKTQIAPGFDDRTLYSELDQRNFLYGVESFYQTKGTEQSFEILFEHFMDWMLRLLIPLNIFSVLPMQIIRSLKIL